MTERDNIETPTLILDEVKCRNNILRMSKKAAAVECTLRPHFKTHQSIEIGNWFRDVGVTNIACSSFGMALYFASAGWNDITVAFPVNLREWRIIDDLARRVRLTVLVESPFVIASLDKSISHSVNALVKIDVGSHRTGISPLNTDLIEECIDGIIASERLRWSGFLAHAGHTYQATGVDQIEEIHAEATSGLRALRGYLGNSDGQPYISYGDTPSCSSAMNNWDGIDEMRPGNYVFYDLMQSGIGSCDKNDIAVAMACPVVAVHPERDVCVIYGGGIHFAKDRMAMPDGSVNYGEMVNFTGDGWMTNDRGCYIKSVSQEHGVVHVPSSMINNIRPGDLMYFLPVHSCMTAQCMKRYRTLSGTWIDHYADTQ